MSVRRTLAILRKEFRHIFRDLRLFFLVTGSPAFLLFLLAHLFVLDIQQVEMAVWDMDRSVRSRQMVATLTADGEFRVQAWVHSYSELEPLLRTGRVDCGLVIPGGFARQQESGRPATVEAIVDGSDPIAAIQAVASLSKRVSALTPGPTHSPPLLIDVRSEAWYNPALKSLVSMVPGLAAIVLCMPALALALALTREKEIGSFESLIATPVRGAEYLLGKLGAYLACGLLGVLPVWLVAVLYFQVPFRGHVLLYLALSAVYFLAEMGFSLIVANFVRNQQTAMLLVLTAFFVPSFFIAGLILPVDTHNILSMLVSYALPATHFVAISRGVFLKGIGPAPLQMHILLLLGMGLGGLLLSLLLFRKRLG
ncbi:MAG: ABC transporter permease [Anaerolineae bacterium]|nr:ABC transporter permease [Anaerolineae bacterium]MDW8068499.1 ABC transporter permease [Anaerolineae bacterium]